MEVIPHIEELKYPIGKFKFHTETPFQEKEVWLDHMREFPDKLLNIRKTIQEEEFDWKYRQDGWNIKQVIHHCADSHMNGLIRTKLALTEIDPTIRPYQEAEWAELIDYRQSIDESIELIRQVHSKWVLLFENLKSEEWKRGYYHPEDEKHYSLLEQLDLYAWHCAHHYAHIEQALKYKGRFN